MFSALDWLPTLVDVAGGPKGDALKKQIEAGTYPDIVKTTLDGVDQRAYLEGTSEKSARDVFFYYTGSQPSAVRYKNWKFLLYDGAGTGGLFGAQSFHWTQIANIKRDPFEQTIGADAKSLLGYAFDRLAKHCLPLRLEYPADRSTALEKRTDVLQGIPTGAGAGNL
jgi:arylsulfatase A-like enzyme